MVINTHAWNRVWSLISLPHCFLLAIEVIPLKYYMSRSYWDATKLFITVSRQKVCEPVVVGYWFGLRYLGQKNTVTLRVPPIPKAIQHTNNHWPTRTRDPHPSPWYSSHHGLQQSGHSSMQDYRLPLPCASPAWSYVFEGHFTRVSMVKEAFCKELWARID